MKKTVVNKLLKMKKSASALIAFLMLFCTTAVFGQSIPITGTIIDSNGEPLSGVSIAIKGASQGTVTDANGAYNLTVPNENAVLVFSYVGFITQEIKVGNLKNINVKLNEDTQKMDEVVVIGYGNVRKQDLTGSVGTVAARDIVLRGTTSVLGAMQGAIPGVDIAQSGSRVGNGFNIQIRGVTTMNDGAKSPLYVVDGIFTDNIDFLNPLEIERVDILKDASSTAIYGSRGSNGVVLVTTKTAIGAKSKTTVSYDGFYGVKKPSHMPEFMDGREFISHRWMCYYTWIVDNPNEVKAGKEEFGHWSAGSSPTQPILAQRLYNKDYFDWLNACLQTGKEQNHYVNISGSAKDLSYNMGLGYSHVDGTFIKEVSDRYNFKLSVHHQPSKYFQSGANLNLSFTNTDRGSTTSYSSCMSFAPIFHAYRADGSYVLQPAGGDETGANYTSTANPLLFLENETEQTRLYRIIGSFYAQVSPIAGLDIKTTFSPSFVRNRIGYFNKGIVHPSGTIIAEKVGSSDNYENFDIIWQNQMNYMKTFNKHRVNTVIFNDVYSTRYERLYVQARLLPYDSYWYNLYSGTINVGNGRSEYQETSMISYGARMQYEYAGKYLATATLRYDGSSKLVQRWSSFPSCALAWRLSEEDFMQAPWISTLKPRASLGYSGNNAGVGPFGALQKPVTTSSVQYDFNGVAVSGFAPGNPVNESLGWEKTREANFGIDFGFLKNRINGYIELYDKLSDGLLMSRRLAIESGVYSMTDNVGSVNNRGIDIFLNTVNINTSDFYWTTTFTFSHNRNALRTLYGRKEDVPGESRFIGKPINIVYDYKISGIFTQAEYDAGLTKYIRADNGQIFHKARPGQAKTQDTNGDGIINGDDKVILGQSDPNWIGGLTSQMQYKNCDFSFSVTSRQGVFYLDQFLQTFGWASGRGTNKVKYGSYYTPQNVNIPDYDNYIYVDGVINQIGVKNSGTGNENVKYPLYTNAGQAGFYGNNGSYQDGSFVKVKSIAVGYTFDKALIQKTGMSYLRVYATVTNPFIFTKNYIGWDPEYGNLAMSNGNGPSSITYQVGLNVKF